MPAFLWISKCLFSAIFRRETTAYRHFRWDEELAEVAQIWADQCANVVYFHQSDAYPRIFHERGYERTTSKFNSPPGVGQNVAWALTKHVNFTRIIDDLWYRDINKLQPGRIGDFQVIWRRNLSTFLTHLPVGREGRGVARAFCRLIINELATK